LTRKKPHLKNRGAPIVGHGLPWAKNHSDLQRWNQKSPVAEAYGGPLLVLDQYRQLQYNAPEEKGSWWLHFITIKHLARKEYDSPISVTTATVDCPGCTC